MNSAIVANFGKKYNKNCNAFAFQTRRSWATGVWLSLLGSERVEESDNLWQGVQKWRPNCQTLLGGEKIFGSEFGVAFPNPLPIQMYLNLFQVLEDYSQDLQKKFLLFTTGSDRVPVGGMGEMSLKISKKNLPPEKSGRRGSYLLAIFKARHTFGITQAYFCSGKFELWYNWNMLHISVIP